MKIRGNFPLADYVQANHGDVKKAFFSVPFDWSKKYICQEKMDGWNATFIKKNGVARWANDWEQYAELMAMLPALNQYFPDDTVVVGEVGYGTNAETAFAMRHGYHRFVMFDVLKWNGEIMIHKPAIERYGILQQGKKDAQVQLVSTIPLMFTEERNQSMCWEMFESVTSRGGEGCILKEVGAKYLLGKDSREMYKIKKYITKDYILMGFEHSNAETYLAKEMTISSMICGLFIDGMLKPVTKTSGFDFKWRKEFTEHPEQYIGRVVELGGNGMFPSGAMRHSTFLRFREDRKPEECIL